MDMQSAVEAAESRTDPLLPDGKYRLRIETAEFKRNQNDTLMLACRFIFLDGDNEGKSHFQDFVLDHKTSAYACQLGAAMVRELLNAVRMPQEKDPEAIVGEAVVGLIETQGQKGQYPARNILVGFEEVPPTYPDKKNNGAAKPPPPVRVAPPLPVGNPVSLDDDDIPF